MFLDRSTLSYRSPFYGNETLKVPKEDRVVMHQRGAPILLSTGEMDDDHSAWTSLFLVWFIFLIQMSLVVAGMLYCTGKYCARGRSSVLGTCRRCIWGFMEPWCYQFRNTEQHQKKLVRRDTGLTQASADSYPNTSTSKYTF